MTLLSATLTMREGRDLGYLDGASERMTFGRIKGDLERFAYASIMVEVITHLIPPHGYEAGVFELLAKALSHLEHRDEIDESLVALFELRMLRGLGLLPTWESLAGVPEAALPILDGWLQSEWHPLPEGTLFATISALERLIQESSGRPLKSRVVLSELLER